MNLILQNFISILESNFNYLSQIFSKDSDIRFSSEDGLRIFWTQEISSDFAKSINSFLDFSFRDKSSLLKLTKARSIAIGTLPQSDSQEKKVFIKKYLVTNRLKGVLNLISPSKAWREMHLTRKLVNSGIPTAKPLLVAEKRCNSRLKESYLITEEIPDTKTFLSFIKQEPSQKKKRELLLKLASFVSRLHNEGFFHADLSLKNILVSNTNGNDLKLFVMDIDKGILLKRLSSWSKAKNLFQILRFMKQKHSFTEEDKKFLVDSYSKNSTSLPVDKLWQRMKMVRLYTIAKENYRRAKKEYFKRKKGYIAF